MTRKNPFPRSKVRARPDVKSFEATIPERTMKESHLRAGDVLQWVVVPAPNGEYIEVRKVA